MSPARILVADDDLTTALLMQAALVQAGFAVELAADGEAALQAFARAHLRHGAARRGHARAWTAMRSAASCADAAATSCPS